MSKLTKDIEKLASIGKDLVAEGYELGGSNHTNLPDNISVYTAESGNHRSFDIDHLSIAYFNPIQIEGRVDSFTHIPEYIDRAYAVLNKLKTARENETKSEARLRKADRIAKLKQELKDLES